MVNLKLLRSFIQLSWIALCIIIVLLTSPLWLHEPLEEAETIAFSATPNSNSLSPKAEIYPNFMKGKELFKKNCATCHNKNLIDHLTGPALAGLADRWSEYPQADLYRWIRNSQAMIEEGHPRALSLWKDWGPIEMSNFPNLTDEEVNDLLIFIENNG